MPLCNGVVSYQTSSVVFPRLTTARLYRGDKEAIGRIKGATSVSVPHPMPLATTLGIPPHPRSVPRLMTERIVVTANSLASNPLQAGHSAGLQQ